MSRYDENSNSKLEQEMLTFEERVLGGNLFQRFGSGSELDPEPNWDFGPVANAGPSCVLKSSMAVTSVLTIFNDI